MKASASPLPLSSSTFRISPIGRIPIIRIPIIRIPIIRIPIIRIPLAWGATCSPHDALTGKERKRESL
ncbi:hypothetical protein AV530_006744 [Patagioenas fasciata monilis]|uniref:Uncharacterized protein n=1 Tax=Patagioenas fasciata monilis TaxID=372326 RepID=A0A1V4KQ76_PATFA|nr:hypothetical protein AV530_006744 [Patagioenas fasciata monilis]